MDITTLAAAKTYTNNKVEEIIKGGDTSVVDPTLSLSGSAADAKVTGDRLGAIEYQTVTTEQAYEHKDLPEGKKTVIIQGDGVFGETAYIGNFTNLIPNSGFDRNFPFRGVTVSKKGNGYVISGTSVDNDSSVYFTDDTGNIKIPVSAELIGKTLLHIVCCNVQNGNAVLNVHFYNENNTELLRESDSLRNRTKEIVVPEGATYFSARVYYPNGNTYNNEFKYFLIEKDKCQAITLNENTTEISNITDTTFCNIPYKSTVSYIVTLRELIDEYAGGGEVTYLTPEDFGAIGDGSADDGEAIAECLDYASQTGQMVIMAKKYYISSPIIITQSRLEIICNDIIYSGTDCAVKIIGRENKIKIHSIISNGIGLVFEATGQKSTSYNSVEINTISSQSHGIAFIRGTSYAHQNTVRFELIRAGGSGCYGICFLTPEGTAGFIAECNLYGGQISNCEWAVYKVGGNSKCYGFHIEENVQGGFYTEESGGLIVYYPRSAEAQRDGKLPFYKFTGTANVHIYGSSLLPFSEIDLTDAIDVFENDAGGEAPLNEAKLSIYYGAIIPKPHAEGENVQIASVYTTKAYIWGKYLIMTPYMAYRKIVDEAVFDTRILVSKDDENYDARLRRFSQLPTKFIVNTMNSDIYLHESYCAFGFNEFEVEQSNGFTCKVYDRLENLIFDGTDKGDGLYKFNVYKDSEFCADYSSGLLRRDFLGHYWNVEKINIPTKISQLENDLGFTSGSNGSAPAQSSESYELIETITLAEDATSVTRNQYPDGTVYKFKELYLKMVCPQATTAGSARYKIKAGTSTLLNANVTNVTSTSASNASSVKHLNNKGIYESTIYAGGGGGIRNVQYYNSLTQPYTRAEKGAITEWEITADSCEVLPAGTVIYAYGIKDYEK